MKFDKPLKTQLDQIMRIQADWPEMVKTHRDQAINSTIGVILDPTSNKPMRPQIVDQIMTESLSEINLTQDRGYQSQRGHGGYLKAHSNWVMDEYEEDWPQAQSIGGTGALTLAAEMMKQTSNTRKLLIDPGYGNHKNIFKDFDISIYKRQVDNHPGYDHSVYVDALKSSSDNSWVLLQAVAYNGDGHDRTARQWDEIYEILSAKSMAVVIDCAYYGLADSFESDSYALKKLLKTDVPAMVCLSNSKNLGLYQERLGALYCLNVPKDQVSDWQSQLNVIVRRLYSNASRLVAETASEVLSNDSYISQVEREIDQIRTGLLIANRRAIVDVLGSEYSWINQTKGLFLQLFTGGFSELQLDQLRAKGVLILPNSRINVASISPASIHRFADNLKSVI